MTPVNNLSAAGAAPLAGAGLSPSGEAGARQLAGSAIGEVGHRVLAWVGQSVPGQDAASSAWATSGGAGSGFRPDPAELARRGDVYGLRDLAASVSGQAGGTPAQEGELHRALTDFTREAAVQLAGLSGAAGDRQLSGLRTALDAALDAPAGGGVDGVVARLATATRSLAAANGN